MSFRPHTKSLIMLALAIVSGTSAVGAAHLWMDAQRVQAAPAFTAAHKYVPLPRRKPAFDPLVEVTVIRASKAQAYRVEQE